MKILFLLRLWPSYGGGETVTITLANEMLNRGHDVNVLYFKDSAFKAVPYIHKRLKAIRIPDVSIDENTNYNDEKVFINEDAVSSYLCDFIKKNDINITINQWWPDSFTKGVKSNTNSKIVKCLHTAFYNPNFYDGIKGYFNRLIEPIYKPIKLRKCANDVIRSLRYVDKYVFLSTRFESQFNRISKGKYQKYVYSISNPLACTCQLSDAEKALKENIVLIVGRMYEPAKKITRALRIWQKIENDYNIDNWRLQIVGDGPDLDFYKEYKNRLGLKNVDFFGHQQPSPFYSKAKIFIMTSNFEGFGMTLIEAQQFGVVPVVMDSFLSLHDIIVNDYSGIISRDNDEESFAKVLKNLFSNDAKLAQLANNATNSCKQFSVETIVNKWELLLKDLSAN